MNLFHWMVSIVGTVVVGCLFICGVGFLTILVGVWVDQRRLKVLTSEGAEAELARLNVVERERRHTVILNAPNDSSAANWLIRDSRDGRAA